MLFFSQCDIFSQLLHNWHYTNVCSISSTYTYNTVWNTLPSIMTLLFTYASFSQYDIFSQLLPNWLYNNVYSISSTYTYGTVYNYTTQYSRFAVYICFPFHNVIFFLNYCIIHSTTVFTAYPQHMHTVLFTITHPVDWLCCLHMLFFSQCDIFLNYCIIHSTTVFTAYPQHMHTVLFTITLPSRLTLLFTYVILFTMWYFFTITAQLTLQQCLQHIRNIYI